MKRFGIFASIIALLLCCILCACTPKTTTTPTHNATAEAVVVDNSTTVDMSNAPATVKGDAFEKNTYRTLWTLKTMYKIMMLTANDLYNDEKITPVQKQQIIDLGKIYYGSYLSMVTAFEVYKKSHSEDDKLSLTTLMFAAVKNYNAVIDYYNTITTGINGVQQWKKM